MKRYGYILAVAMTHVTLVYPVRITMESVSQGIAELPFQTSLQARGIAFLLYKDKEFATRYVKHAEFYAKKSKRSWVNDNIIDHVGYPIVDNIVGIGMSKVSNDVKPIRAAAESMSKNNRKFIANNIQLIGSAAIIRGIRFGYEKSVDSEDTKQALYKQYELPVDKSSDLKKFGKSCAAQVGCDVVDEFLVKPAVEAYVGDTTSWTASIVRGASNYVLAQVVMNQVSKL